MTKLTVVGGKDVGDAELPPVFQDEESGVARVLKNILRNDDVVAVVCVAARSSGEIFIGSNLEMIEEALGMLHRGQHTLCTIADGVVDASEQVPE